MGVSSFSFNVLISSGFFDSFNRFLFILDGVGVALCWSFALYYALNLSFILHFLISSLFFFPIFYPSRYSLLEFLGIFLFRLGRLGFPLVAGVSLVQDRAFWIACFLLARFGDISIGWHIWFGLTGPRGVGSQFGCRGRLGCSVECLKPGCWVTF